MERVLDMKEYFDKQQKKEEKGQKVVQAETVQTGTVGIFRDAGEGNKCLSCLSFRGAGGAKVPFLKCNEILFWTLI